MISDNLGYVVKPKYLYQKWLNDMNTGQLEVQTVTERLAEYQRTVEATDETEDFNGRFSSSTLDLSDTALGSDLNTRSKNIQALIRLFEDLDMVALQKSDILRKMI